jgi:hypothetical protein
MNDRQRLEAIVAVVCRYLPPDGISREEAMSQIISLVDPLPEQEPWDTSDMEHRSGGLTIEQAEKQEPVGYFDSNVLQVPAIYRGLDGWVTEIYSVPRGNCTFPLYTAPPKREWVGLTDEEIAQAVGSPIDEVYLVDFRKVIEKLRSKNT